MALGSELSKYPVRTIACVSVTLAVAAYAGKALLSSGFGTKNQKKGKITEIWVHPVKSLRGISLQESSLDEFGFKHDRQYMLCIPDKENEGKYTFLTQREVPQLTLVTTSIDYEKDVITLEYKGDTLTIPLSVDTAREYAKVAPNIWGLNPQSIDITDACPGLPEFFNKVRNVDTSDTILVAPDIRRKVVASLPKSENPPESSFQDYYPGNLISATSLKDLDSRVKDRGHDEISLSSRNFRPNMVVDGFPAWDEDYWKEISINGYRWIVPCRNIRCQVTTVNLQKGEFEPSREPYKTMQGFRRIDKGKKFLPCFGMNLVHTDSSQKVKVGDELIVLKTGDHCYKDIATTT